MEDPQRSSNTDFEHQAIAANVRSGHYRRRYGRARQDKLPASDRLESCQRVLLELQEGTRWSQERLECKEKGIVGKHEAYR